MIEAFEIGVSLALRDGVGDAIEKARRDVAAVETAVTAGGISIQRLRAAASESMPPKSDGVHGDSSWPQILPGRGARGDRGEQAALPLVETQKDNFVQFLENVAAPASRVIFTYPERWIPPGVTADDSPTLATQRPAVPSPALRAIGAQDERNGPSNPVLQSWNLTPTPVNIPLHISAPYTDAQPNDQIVNSTVLSSIGATSAPVSQVLATYAAQGAIPNRPALPNAPASLLRHGRMEISAAPRLSEEQDQNFNASSSGGAAVADQSRSTQGRDRSQEAIEGDVYLDDMLVGRWMSRFLNRAAGRAPVGPTAFDPRRSRLLPGATVGI